MFKTSTQIVKNSIFPLFYHGQIGQNTTFGVQGTGFFIDEDGHFLTAAHVVKMLPKGTNFGYAGNIPHVNIKGAAFENVQIIAIDSSKDLALGKVESGQLAPLKFAETDAVIGESISLCGYPLPSIKPSTKVENGASKKVVNLTLDVTAVRQYWQPTIKMDKLSKGMLYNKTFNSFITQHSTLPGMSGGPVFNVRGEVVGLTSANWTRKVQRSQTEVTKVENGIGVSLDELKIFVNSNLNKAAA